MGFGGYDHWKTTEPDPGFERTDDEGPSELDLVYGDLAAANSDMEKVRAAGMKLLAEIDDHYDVDDGHPNIPGDIMLAARALDAALKAVGRAK